MRVARRERPAYPPSPRRSHVRMCERARRRRASYGQRSRSRRARARRRARPFPRDARPRAETRNSSSPPIRRTAARAGSRRRRSYAWEVSKNKDRTTIGKNTSAMLCQTFQPFAMFARRFAPLADNLARGDPLLAAARALSQARDCVEEQPPEALGVDGDRDFGVGEAAPLAAPVDDRGADRQASCGLDVDGRAPRLDDRRVERYRDR